MLLLLLSYLQSMGAKVPSFFYYSSTRMLLAALGAFVLTLFFAPVFIRKLYQLKIGQPIRKDECPPLAKLHEKKEHTPTMGGVLILSALLLSMLCWMRLDQPFTWILFFSTLSLGLLGATDDYLKLKSHSSKGLGGRWKLLGQCAVGLGIASYLYFPLISNFFPQPIIHPHYMSGSEGGQIFLSIQEFGGHIFFPFFRNPLVVLSGAGIIVGIIFTMFVVMGSSNSVNLTDGLDGLATGCIIMASIPLAIVAFISNHATVAQYLNILYIDGSSEIAVCLSALIGACLGFLWYNGHPAQVFMGDTGSLSMGGLLGVAAVLMRREFLLGIVGGVFVLEALSVIIQVLSYRYRAKKRVFLCAPLHHHFEYKGWPETRVVIRFWIIGLLLACIAILSIKAQ